MTNLNHNHPRLLWHTAWVLLLAVLAVGCGSLEVTHYLEKGAVATAAPIATTVGEEVFAEGGNAFDAAVAWSFTEGTFYLHADYLIHFRTIIEPDVGELPFYFGVGGKINLHQEPQLGVRVPVGVSYIFESAPVDVFLELAPGIGLYPSTSFDFGGGIGLRYYFGSGKNAGA